MRLFCRNEIEILPSRNRTVTERLLLTSGSFHNVVANKIKKPPNFKARGLDVIRKAIAKGLFWPSPSKAVSPSFAAYTTSVPASGSIATKPRATEPAYKGLRPLHLMGERVVSASVQNNKAQFLRPFGRVQDVFQRYGSNPISRSEAIFASVGIR